MEQRKIPAAGEFYRHFKGNLYQIIGIAKHSETEEPMVVYQALYGDYCLYVRPYAEFIGPVDQKKYPDAVQQFRFEQVQLGTNIILEKKDSTVTKKDTRMQSQVKECAKKDTKEVFSQTSEAETVREEILRFLDAEGATEKLEVLRSLRKKMDENLITTMELSMDLVPDEKESLERRYELIEQILEKRIRFEGGRLR